MKILILAPLALLAACASPPSGPTVRVMPQHGKSLASFQEDNVICKDYATNEIADGAGHVNTRQALTAGITTLLGGGLGAAVGGGKGAAIGAGAGLLGGAGVGGLMASRAGDTLQDRYNAAYTACMATKHNRVA